MNELEIENYLPYCTDEFLKAIYVIRDGLRRHSFKEARLHIGDMLATVQNEIDWCYRTDPVLVFVRDYLLQLDTAVGVLQRVDKTHVRPILTETLAVLEDTRRDVEQRSANVPRWPKPGPSVDALERDHRAFTYGYHDELQKNSQSIPNFIPKDSE